MPEDVSWSHFFSFEKAFSRVSLLKFCHYFICYLWPTKFLITFLPIISRITMCNLHWYYTFCNGVKLFALVLYLNFTALSQSELSNFFLCIITKVYVAFTPGWVFNFTHFWYLLLLFFPNHYSGNSQFSEDCYYHSLRFSDSIELGIAF